VLDRITPLILTYNEAPNIGRVLEQARWAKDIVLVDSFSGDDTLHIASRFPQVRIFRRQFDSHAAQWNYGLRETGISTEWVLALDADYLLTDELIEELRATRPDAATAGFRAKFVYCVFGRELRGSAYPAKTILYRRESASYFQDGHTQRVAIDGRISGLKAPMRHDDRKPLSRWLLAQDRYMRLEAEKLSRSAWRDLGWPDRIRTMVVVFPFVVFFYCLFVKRAVLDGRAGLYYSFQRMAAECILSLHILFRRCAPRSSEKNASGDGT
jgi:glycosyltransferase involved in cell wall biosynthesis